MTVLLIVLLMITACVFAYEHSKRRLMQAVLDCTAVDDDEAVTKHAQVAALRSVGITLPPEQERELLWHSDPEQSMFYAHCPYWGMLGSGEFDWDRVYSPGDAECVQEEDAYVPIFEGLARISGLPMGDIRGHDRYFADFTLAGHPVSFRAKESRDFLDPKVGEFLNRQIRKYLPETKERFFLDGGRPAPIWYWGTETEAQAVNGKTGMKFR